MQTRSFIGQSKPTETFSVKVFRGILEIVHARGIDSLIGSITDVTISLNTTSLLY